MPKKHSDRCQYKNCREQSDVIAEGKPLCMKHHQMHLEEKDREWVSRHPDFYINEQGFIKKRPAETTSQTSSPAIPKKKHPSLDDFYRMSEK